MAVDQAITPPAVYWAQRASTVFLSVGLEECKDAVVNFEKDKVFFSGTGGTEKKKHEVTINLYKPIDPEASKYIVTGRTIEIVLKKAEEGPYWPRLTNETSKCHWLKVNFSKWKDEDDSDFAEDDDEGGLEEMMKSMGGAGGDWAGKPDFNHLPEEDSDDDDSDIPPLE